MKKMIRGIFTDIKEKKYLEGYVAFLILIILGFVDIFKNELISRIMDPILIFSLSIIIANLISTRKTDESLERVIQTNTSLQIQLLELTRNYRVSYEFIPMELGDNSSYSRIRQKTRDIISNAKHEVLIMDNNNSPLPDNIRYAQGVVDTDERKAYYQELLNKVQSPPDRRFRYVRIMQAIDKQRLIEGLREDDILLKHYQEVAKISTILPQSAAGRPG
jgi:hypothetical protein